MKSKIILTASAFIIILSIQAYSQCLTGFGIKAGATISNDIFDYVFNSRFRTKYHIGYNASLFADFLKNRNFNIQAELGYDQRGYKLPIIRTDEFGNELGEYSDSYDTHYFTSAILGKLKITGNSLTPYFLVGPRLDIYLGYTAHYDNYIIVNQEIKNPVLEEFKKINYSVTLGVGLEFEKLLPYNTFIELTVQPPLNTSLESTYLNVKEHSFNAKLGINFIKDKVKPKRK